MGCSLWVPIREPLPHSRRPRLYAGVLNALGQHSLNLTKVRSKMKYLHSPGIVSWHWDFRSSTQNRNKHVGAVRSRVNQHIWAGHSFILLLPFRLVYHRSLMKTIKFAGPGWSLYETLFGVFTSPAARWGHLVQLCLVRSHVRPVRAVLQFNWCCPGNNTRRQGRSVTGPECISYRISVSQCVTLTIYIGYPGSKNAQISHLAQYYSI